MNIPLKQNLKEFDYSWPSPDNLNEPPVWTGNGFMYNGKLISVFSYDKNDSNWTQELTSMHEVEAGLNHPIDVASRKLAINTIATYCNKSNPILLEIGSSSGYFISELQSNLPHINIIGSDFISEPLINLAKKYPHIPFIQFDLQNCILRSDSLDAVVLLNVLEHVKDDEVAINHLARILMKGGIAHIEVPSSPQCFDIYDEYLMHYRRYRMQDLIKLFKKAGFTIIKSTHLGFLPYIPFYIVKRLNRRLHLLPQEEKRKVIISQIRKTKRSKLLDFLIRSELKLGKYINFPFGIRCVLVLKKL